MNYIARWEERKINEFGNSVMGTSYSYKEFETIGKLKGWLRYGQGNHLMEFPDDYHLQLFQISNKIEIDVSTIMEEG